MSFSTHATHVTSVLSLFSTIYCQIHYITKQYKIFYSSCVHGMHSPDYGCILKQPYAISSIHHAALVSSYENSKNQFAQSTKQRSCHQNMPLEANVRQHSHPKRQETLAVCN